MKDLTIIFALSIGLLTVSCSDDDDTSPSGGDPTGGEVPDKSDFYMVGNVDGVVHAFSTDDGSFDYINSIFSGDTECSRSAQGRFTNNFGEGTLEFSVGFTFFEPGGPCAESYDFFALFDPGEYAFYSSDIANDSGAVVRYRPAGGPVYSSAGGDQSGSSFILEEVEALPADFDPGHGADEYVTVKGTFSCTLYTSSGDDSFEVNDGTFFVALASDG